VEDHVPPSTDPAIVVQDLVKTFGSTRALRGVSLDVKAGTVHALMGENGAGKSTALGAIAGRISPSSGRVEVFGEELSYGDPRRSMRAGVVAIYQELTIVPALTAEANVFLSHPLNKAGFLTKREMRRRYIALCKRVGVTASPGTLARDLGIAEQQILEILRALVADAKIVLFDEPTASLAVPEREALFRLMRNLRSEGITMILVSHNLEEVLDISDFISVFRDGRLIITADRAHFTKAELVNAMLGKTGDARITADLLHASEESGRAATLARQTRTDKDSTAVLAVSNLSVPGALTGIDLELRGGEVLGLGGLVGSGRTSVLRALAGLTPTATGRMWIDGKEVPWPRTVRRALQYGIALIPEDRKSQGLVMQLRVADNIALSDFRRITRRGVLTPQAVVAACKDIAPQFGLSPTRLGDPASALSGGNQQKLLLARWKHVTPRILLADEPTRGIDVGAKAEILKSLEGMAAQGLGIIMVSSELEEVVAISDRVLVLSEGLPAGEINAADGPITTQKILDRAFRVHAIDASD
jgi:rhamnose transport system ATP-binding protein